MVLGGAIASIAPSEIAPVLTLLRMPMSLTYHEFKTACLRSVQKRIHRHISHSLLIYMLRHNVDLKTIIRNYRKSSWILGVRDKLQ